MKDHQYVALVRHLWADYFESLSGFSLRNTGEDGSIGFVPVFASREDAEAAYPDAIIVAIKSTRSLSKEGKGK